jgi:hypothetical protein
MSDQVGDEVRPEEERGCSLGIDSVRHFVRNGRFARSDAHEPATILAAIGPAVQSQEA